MKCRLSLSNVLSDGIIKNATVLSAAFFINVNQILLTVSFFENLQNEYYSESRYKDNAGKYREQQS